MADWVARWENR